MLEAKTKGGAYRSPGVGLALGGCSSLTSDQAKIVGSTPDEQAGVNIDSDGQVHIGAEASVDLAVFFKPAVRDEEISGFIQTTLNSPVPGGGHLGDETDLLSDMHRPWPTTSGTPSTSASSTTPCRRNVKPSRR